MVLVNPEVLFKIKADVSKDRAGVVFIQRDKKGRLYLVVFLSYKFTDTKRQYLIYNKELIAIILACK